MNLDLLKPLLEALKLRPIHVATVGGVCAALLFGPADVLHVLGVAQLAQDYRALLGVALLACVASAGALGVSWVAGVARQRLQQRRVRLYLRGLTEPERDVLRLYLRQQTRTQALHCGDGVVCGLEAAGVITRVSNVGDRDLSFAYNITPAAWAVLQHDQDVVRAINGRVRGIE